MTNENQNPSTARRSAAEQEKVREAVVDVFERLISFNQYLGFKVGTLGADEVQIGFAMKPELIGHYQHGRLHGGVISAVLDATGGLAVMWGLTERHAGDSAAATLARFAHLGTIDMRIDYLRTGVGEQFTASARVRRLGRRIATTQMTLVNEQGREIAAGAGTYIVS